MSDLCAVWVLVVRFVARSHLHCTQGRLQTATNAAGEAGRGYSLPSAHVGSLNFLSPARISFNRCSKSPVVAWLRRSICCSSRRKDLGPSRSQVYPDIDVAGKPDTPQSAGALACDVPGEPRVRDATRKHQSAPRRFARL